MMFLSSFFTLIFTVFSTARLLTWDVLLTLGNLVWPKVPVGKVTPRGHAGFGGNWPEYKAPQAGDCRSACPGLNALANHGIIARDGKALTFPDVDKHIETTFKLSATLSASIGKFAANMLKKDYNKDTFDLEEISLHNGIEHDASLTRLDVALQPNQAGTYPPFIDEFFTFASGKDSAGTPLFTVNDLSRILGKRRVDCKAMNKEYGLDLSHKLFGSANTSFLYTVFGGQVDDIRAFLYEERLSDGWESQVREPWGLTITAHNTIGLRVEAGVRESDWTHKAKQIAPVDSADKTV